MFRLLRLILRLARRSLRTRRDLLLENLALRQQLSVLKRHHPKDKIPTIDKLFWVWIRQIWSGWKGPLRLVHPDSVTRWHRAGFRLYWSLLSKPNKPAGRKRISKQVRDLIFRMVVENPTWGAPRIHGELLMLGFDLSERTISRWMKRAPKDPDRAKRWLAFFRNHREAIAAMDFFTVPTVTFGVLYCFFIISHDRRRILHVNVTKHPTSAWIIQQLREAFPFEASHKYLIFDRDQTFGFDVIASVKTTKIIPKRTSFRSPWPNGIAERWVGSCRRDLLDHIVALNERHLKRLLSEYVRYHHEDRTHLGLEKGTPEGRIRSVASGRVLAQGASRRAAPSLRSSRLVRIDFPTILSIYVRCARKRVPVLQSFRAVSRRGLDSGLLYQERTRFWSRLKFWRRTG